MDARNRAAPDAIFGAVRIADKTCSSTGCVRPPVTAMPWRTAEEGTSVLWACERHAQRVTQEAAKQGVSAPLHEVSLTCRAGDDVPCGAAATHLVVVGIKDVGWVC